SHSRRPHAIPSVQQPQPPHSQWIIPHDGCQWSRFYPCWVRKLYAAQDGARSCGALTTGCLLEAVSPPADPPPHAASTRIPFSASSRWIAAPSYLASL